MFREYLLQTRISDILNVSVDQKTWLSICFKTRGRAFETLSRVFETLCRDFEGLRENQKHGQEFERLGRVFGKLGCVLCPCCPNQPR